jgi:hypothetical protein
MPRQYRDGPDRYTMTPRPAAGLPTSSPRRRTTSCVSAPPRSASRRRCSLSSRAPGRPPLSIPNQLESAISLDKAAHTVTLPLYQGVSRGQRAYRLRYRLDRESGGRLPGQRRLPRRAPRAPRPRPLPRATGQHAGPVDDRRYSPLFMFGNGVEQIANATGVHPKVRALDTRRRRSRSSSPKAAS